MANKTVSVSIEVQAKRQLRLDRKKSSREKSIELRARRANIARFGARI